MFKFAFATLVLAAVLVRSESFTITGPSWKNEMKACASGGEHRQEYNFNLGYISDYNAKIEDITSTTTVTAEGDLEFKTGLTGWVPRTSLQLSETSESSEYKQFRGKWNMDAQRGWGSQAVQMVLTLKFYQNGKITLDNYVSAGSWMSVTCSEVRAYVDRILVVV